jgi:D-amino-acid dehydrogenase
MKVLGVGGGLFGITSAYFLNQLGHEVLVVERELGPGLGASFANGALLTPSPILGTAQEAGVHS